MDARLEAEAARRRLAAEALAARQAPPQPAATVTPALTPRPAALSSVALPTDLTAPGRGTGFWFAVVGLPCLCLTAIAGTWLYTQHRQATAPTARPIPVARPELRVASLAPRAPVQVTPVSAPATAPTVAATAPTRAPTSEAAKATPPSRPRPARPKPRPKPAKPAGPPGLQIDFDLSKTE
ncbi:MAG: hypothetical protein H6702_09820 [Myxococcales bacterium]|nr:hypothetical protein [Myxococcales bacterium]